MVNQSFRKQEAGHKRNCFHLSPYSKPRKGCQYFIVVIIYIRVRASMVCGLNLFLLFNLYNQFQEFASLFSLQWQKSKLFLKALNILLRFGCFPVKLFCRSICISFLSFKLSLCLFSHFPPQITIAYDKIIILIC